MCECGNRLITLNSMYLDDFSQDAEPYENNVEEKLNHEDEDFVQGLDMELNFNACSKCKTIYMWVNGDEVVVDAKK